MPRIDADNIEEHVRKQNERILAAADQLFNERGYRGTDMGEIARSIGLARNSLYRYYPSKDHILIACVKRGMADSLARFGSIRDDIDDPVRRIDAWLDLQMEVALGPCHATMQMVGEVPDSSSELRSEIMALHNVPNAVLDQAICEAVRGTDRDPTLLARMIAGMVQAAARLAIDSGESTAITRQLKDSVAAILRA